MELLSIENRTPKDNGVGTAEDGPGRRVGPCPVSASADNGSGLSHLFPHQAVSSSVTGRSSPPDQWRAGWSPDECPPLPLGLRASTAHRDLRIKDYWRKNRRTARGRRRD